ncbi:hypothetical protein WICMUC_001746 [Wickerhamomyces mucosus]|uniref:mRNA export factor GLE1 n=1 Tax=Wickerhamomyces mucosus TaxID=1378264 RepID=A0A9P8TFH3_9ASCO|nr:hypothetical protein WICMUC_001746 [Wickerhamomyces mucosus]
MRFSPHRSIPNSSYGEIDSDYDSLSDDEEMNRVVKSSPLKSMNDESPLKFYTNNYINDIRTSSTTHKVLHSSPLAKSQFSTPDKSRSFQDESIAIEELTGLLKDIRVKERFELIKTSSLTRQKSRSRPLSAKHTRRSSLHSSSSSPLHPSEQATLHVVSSKEKVHETVDLKKAQASVISDLENRLDHRAKQIEIQLQQLEEEKKRRAEDLKRKEELEKQRKEEEKARQEEEEKKKKEEETRLKNIEEERKLAEEKRLKEEAEKAKSEAERKAKEKIEEEKKQREIDAANAAKKELGVTNNEIIEKEFLHYKTMIHTIKTDIVEKVKGDLQTKNAILKHKRKINPKFGQLTNSLTQLSRISNEVISMINETKSLEIAYKWILNFVAKSIVAQAETEVRASPGSSLPLAKLTLNLLCEFPELKDFLIARFVKKCPFIIGFTCAVDTEQGRLRMGWKRNDGDRWEDEVSYNERISGMMTLYSVITRLPLDQRYFNEIEHPLPLSQSWIMLARLVNQPNKLLTNTHFIVASAWWEAAAYEFQQNYGKQADKFLNLLWISWAQSVENKNFSGAKTLQTVGDDWKHSGLIKKFEPMEP